MAIASKYTGGVTVAGRRASRSHFTVTVNGPVACAEAVHDDDDTALRDDDDAVHGDDDDAVHDDDDTALRDDDDAVHGDDDDDDDGGERFCPPPPSPPPPLRPLCLHGSDSLESYACVTQVSVSRVPGRMWHRGGACVYSRW
jgi:hypothetical protein